MSGGKNKCWAKKTAIASMSGTEMLTRKERVKTL
jgi:hypothetical protein